MMNSVNAAFKSKQCIFFNYISAWKIGHVSVLRKIVHHNKATNNVCMIMY